ncbi:ras and Rab interactor 3 [Ambystoma mexicanum]|uniref:ras and Rab interactor 3 n=1 Tax=Ambystoma mexicanum TaxID=8296 RepID=UPI0037E8442C
MMDTQAAGAVSQASNPVVDLLGEESALQHSALCNGLSPPGIGVLDKLIKTCPVWLQLCMDRERSDQLLNAEPLGVFLVRKDAHLKTLLLSVHVALENKDSDILEYSIKEDKSMLYLEGSVLVFEDIFKLIGFYCVSRDVLPFALRLPHAILEAKTHAELEAISNLGTDFWDSSLNLKGTGVALHPKGTDVSNIQLRGAKPSPYASRGMNQGSCEIELSAGSDRLWFVKPIFIEECSNPRPHDQPPMGSHGVNVQVSTARPSYRRPPPPPPPPSSLKPAGETILRTEICGAEVQPNLEKPYKEMEVNRFEESKEAERKDGSSVDHSPKKCGYPAIPPRRRSTGKQSVDASLALGRMETCGEQDGDGGKTMALDGCSDRVACAGNMPPDVTLVPEPVHTGSKGNEIRPQEGEGLPDQKTPSKAKPLPPPRKKRLSHQLTRTSLGHLKPTVEEAIDDVTADRLNLSVGEAQAEGNAVSSVTNGDAAGDGRASPDSKESITSLNSPLLLTQVSEQDSLSTSSTEDDGERTSNRPVKKTHSMILDKAKNRLSLATLSNVFSAFLSIERKLQRRIIELAEYKDSYFGHLVQDYKAYSLEMMAKHSSSTEMLQEIRMMMTQLKCYLLQSLELKTIIDPAVHKEEKIEVIAEAALCKCVLKPLKEAIDSHLCTIHTNDGTLRLLKENQMVIQGTTTTELGVTTSVPEVVVMEKILHRFATMHKAYSPEKKITFLLKSCKLIYDSMSSGNPGKSHGADDFLPVLMYVLARSNVTELLLDVEYMMELMDPALQLGEGSYYLTTTYGALMHIKNYDKVTVTRQLSMEVQDSIHRWEKRRTLSKARVSRSSVQDFITIAFQEPDMQTRTLALRPDTSAELLAHDCALKFEVADPQLYSLFVLVDERWVQLASDAQPQKIKSYLLKSQTKRDFHFVYKEIDGDESMTATVIKDPDFLE